MSKLIKLENENYIDSSSIVYNRQKLSDILDIQTIPISVNTDYVYYNDMQYTCVKIGKLVILNIQTVAFTQEIPNYQEIIYGLPKPINAIVFYLFGGNVANGNTVRLGLNPNGNIQTHWSPAILYGDSANKQYGGILIYKTNE